MVQTCSMMVLKVIALAGRKEDPRLEAVVNLEEATRHWDRNNTWHHVATRERSEEHLHRAVASKARNQPSDREDLRALQTYSTSWWEEDDLPEAVLESSESTTKSSYHEKATVGSITAAARIANTLLFGGICQSARIRPRHRPGLHQSSSLASLSTFPSKCLLISHCTCTCFCTRTTTIAIAIATAA